MVAFSLPFVGFVFVFVFRLLLCHVLLFLIAGCDPQVKGTAVNRPLVVARCVQRGCVLWPYDYRFQSFREPVNCTGVSEIFSSPA